MLYDTLLRVENEPDNKQLLAWLEGICQPHFQMVDGLVGTFITNLDEPVYARKLLRVLKKMNEYLPQLVVPQFMQNQRFPDAIVRYLEGTDLQDVAGDALVLLVNVFNDQTVDKMSDQFVRQLIKAMDFVTDEHTLLALISILVVLCATFDKKISKQLALGEEPASKVNLAYQEFIENESYYRQKLL